mgnify:CR=1 FL=1
MKKRKKIFQKYWNDNLTPVQEEFIAKFEDMGFVRSRKFCFKVPGGGFVKIISSHNNPDRDRMRITTPSRRTIDHIELLVIVHEVQLMIQDSFDPSVRGRDLYATWYR